MALVTCPRCDASVGIALDGKSRTFMVRPEYHTVDDCIRELRAQRDTLRASWESTMAEWHRAQAQISHLRMLLDRAVDAGLLADAP